MPGSRTFSERRKVNGFRYSCKDFYQPSSLLYGIGITGKAIHDVFTSTKVGTIVMAFELLTRYVTTLRQHHHNLYHTTKESHRI